MDTNNKDISRRDFLKIVGISTAASTAVLAGCGPKGDTSSGSAAQGEIPTDKMTMRVNPKTGEKVSLLGYGCMRWPTLEAPEKGGNVIDQDAVNRLIDYAMAHGVNYYDTSPVYVQGWSERSTGIALKRHPRDKFFIATKLSNFSNYTRENSIAMYERSFKELQVDYIDYYLLHSVGNGGSDTFRARYIDNGMIDFLMKEREAGRIHLDGFFSHPTAVYTVPYGVMVPRRVENLLFPVAVSGSHVGFSTLRMEPCWMALGEAAGEAAALAIDSRTDVRGIDIPELQRRLLENGAVLVYLQDLRPGDADYGAVQQLALKGYFPGWEARLDQPLDAETARLWSSLSGQEIPADGKTTRREWIRRLNPNPKQAQ